MTTWFTSDLHLGHANIIGYCARPFADVAAMNAGLIERWNARVQHTDTVYVLGDVAMGRITDSLSLVDSLHGSKILVTGNHDRCFGADLDPDGKAASWQQRYLDAGFSEVRHGAVNLSVEMPTDALAPGVLPVRACHFPYSGDSGDEDRYVERRPHDDGGWLLHGHVHERWRWHRRMINVGVDAWDYAPVAESQLAAIITAYESDAPTTIIEFDGSAMRTIADFYDQADQLVQPGLSWGRNLDAFNDVLRGGFGRIDDGCFIVWHQSAEAQHHLGATFDTLVEIIHDHGPGADRHGAPTGSNIRLELR
jgi:calcineurin-like phosphoesterase family protein/RNAse (barnase) inhibitor barstar